MSADRPAERGPSGTGGTADTRCPERTPEEARCIYEVGHDGNHFAKEAFSYISWPAERGPSGTGGTATGWSKFGWWLPLRVILMGPLSPLIGIGRAAEVLFYWLDERLSRG